MPQLGLFIGLNRDTGGVVGISEKQRSTHMQVIGSTGTGKSKFLEHLIREDIKAGSGICLIDPHGYLYHDVLKWLQAINWPMRKIILFDPSEDGHITGFNPLRITSKDLSFHVDAMVRACAKVWGGEDTDKTPLLKRCLRITLHALAEHKLTLLEAQFLTSPTNKSYRQFLTENLIDPIIREQWQYFNHPKLTPRQFYEEFGSTINRLMEFLAAERIRMIVGQQEQALDFKTIMDKGYVLLANLSTGRSISHDNAQLLGSLIVNDLFLHATDRPPGSRPFYLYIDECGLFVNEDIARILDEGRKFGLHLVLAHQHLAQLKKAGEDVYYSVMTDAKTKVVFGGLSPEDAKILAEQMFLGEIDLDEYKHSLDRPTVVGHTTTWLRNFSHGTSIATSESETRTLSESVTETHGSSSSETRTKGRGGGFSSGASRGYTRTSDGAVIQISDAVSWGDSSNENASRNSMRGYNYSKAVQMAQSIGETRGTTHTEISQEGQSESLLPILEDRPTATYSLQDQIWKAMDILVNQQTRQAVVKLPGLFTKRIIAPLVEELATSSDATVPHYIARCRKVGNFCKPSQTAKEEIATRHQYLLRAMRKYEFEKAADPTQFKQKKKSGKPSKKESKKAVEDNEQEESSEDEQANQQEEDSFKRKKQKPVN